MRPSNQTLLILLAFILWIRPIEAHHTASHTESDYPPVTIKRNSHTDIIQHNRAILKAYQDYEESAARVWGDEAVVPSAKISVTYRDDLNQRSIVDYEQGNVKVELAVSAEQGDSHEARDKLANAVEQTILQPPDERSIVEIANHR